MKNTLRITTLAALAATLLFVPASFAQSGSDSSGGNASGASGNQTTTTRTEERRDEGTNLGWLGLLGLAGLAGLLKKPQREVVHQTDVRTVTPVVPTHNPNTPSR